MTSDSIQDFGNTETHSVYIEKAWTAWERDFDRFFVSLHLVSRRA